MALTLSLSIETPTIEERLKALVINLSKKNPVVVLVDEYDSAIINNLKDPKLSEKNRDFLKAFFETLKSLDRYIKFTLVTGVSKFSQVSLFFGPNYLTDITMDPKYAGIMGYTEEEIKIHFKKRIQEMSQTKSERGILMSKEQVIDKIRAPGITDTDFMRKTFRSISPTLHFVISMLTKRKVIGTAREHPLFSSMRCAKHPPNRLFHYRAYLH